MARRKLARLLALGVALMAARSALAAGTGGCESFEFPLVTELQWMKADEALAATSGTKLEALPAKAVALTLLPTAQVTFEVPPTGKRKNKPEDAFAASLGFTIAEPGLYQISLSGPGWVDVIQNGAALKSTAHTGKSDCEGLRKSVRFDLVAGPVTIQLADVPAAQIRLTIRKAD